MSSFLKLLCISGCFCLIFGLGWHAQIKSVKPTQFLMQHHTDKGMWYGLADLVAVLALVMISVSFFGIHQRDLYTHATKTYASEIIQVHKYKLNCQEYKKQYVQSKRKLKELPTLKFHNPQVGSMTLSTYNHYLDLKQQDTKQFKHARNKYNSYYIDSEPIFDYGLKHYNNLIQKKSNSIWVKNTKLRNSAIKQANQELSQNHLGKDKEVISND